MLKGLGYKGADTVVEARIFVNKIPIYGDQHKAYTIMSRLGNILAVIRSRPGGRNEAWPSAPARARQTDTSAYVWLAYAMIRIIERLMRNLFSLETFLQEKVRLNRARQLYKSRAVEVTCR